jgi:DNA-binding beta-propeller fold protein YncE
MKHFLKNQLWAFSLLVFAFSCNDNGGEQPLGKYDTGVLIMNEGNFGANDGEVYHLDPATGTLTKDIFELENSRPFAGLLEDMVLEEGRLYLVANTGKVEIVNPGDFKSVGAVIGDLDQPRSLATASGKLFISDYGPYDASYATPDSYIAVVSGLDGGTVKKKIEVSNKPEDLFVNGKFVWAAGSEEGKIEVIDADAETVAKTLEVEGRPVQFLELGGEVWLYAVDSDKVYFSSLNLSGQTVKEVKSFNVAHATGRIAMGEDSKLYLVTSTGWPNYQDGVAVVSIADNSVDTDWTTGSGFYGIGYDKARQEIYLANSNAFQGSGTVTVFKKDGTEAAEMEVGRGPSGFLFR